MKSAYAKLNKKLVKMGEKEIPIEPRTRETYWDPITGRMADPISLAEFEQLADEYVNSEGSELTTGEQEERFDEQFAAIVNPLELEILKLRFVHDLTLRKIAQRIGGVTVNRVTTAYYRSLEKIRKALNRG